ncbi:NAD(P)-dependent dehydrogenase (short-subunit alcohol dehydrogenase family) [Motilibacter peucedani]|uniref:NAD(P)-dependent dehydrogenase (Short-subunit alcohol dehydrogenase family) n=1 Tax=Motilibacter peucedani TaxID=598650 RepID=A0A420XK46_9ACTN|nr:SDR family oxidoreductase [Motilibacter peucedani]RKS67888.1 NAD(P)-dependent dehydrogenase (short-subunit alcohol dehydrogenase family) [Motilibacter peucedani]
MVHARFAGRVAVVLGGGGDIGRATCLRLAGEGAHVVVADSRAQPAQEVVDEVVAAGGTAEAVEVDVLDAASVARVFASVGEGGRGLDVLVLCPARASDTHFERVSESEFDGDVSLTLKAPFFCIQAALPLLLRSPVASVVSIGSVNGIAAFGNEAYGAAKAGLMNLTQNLALRYGAQGVRFNVVAPGTIETRTWDVRRAAEPDVLERIAALYPLKRVGRPEDIAAACAFLASDDAAWVTGTCLAVDGGITAGHGALVGEIFGPGFFGPAASRDDRAGA